MLPSKPALIIKLLIAIALLTATALPQAASAQAPTADKYEDNDTLDAASGVPSTITLPAMTIYPAKDPDFWRIVANPGPVTVSAIGSPGLDLTLNVYGPQGSIIGTANDPAGAGANISFLAPAAAYYIFEVNSTTELTGYYDLQVSNAPATPTPTATLMSTPTPAPYTSTPSLGGDPDKAEPNFDFAHAYRIALGDKLEGLNFNSGSGGQDNDFFVMAVRAGVQYTCQTDNLGPSLDTNLIIYNSPNFSDVTGGNDDINTSAGQINSRLTFTARAEGDIYLLVGYKYAPGMVYPGAATYTLTCYAGPPAAAASSSSGLAGGGAAGSSGASAPARATPVTLMVLQQPTITPPPTTVPIQTLIIDLLVAYDINLNKNPDPNEGVFNLTARVINTTNNQEISYATTDSTGAIHFAVASNDPVRVVIPFLAAAQEFRPGSPAQWTLVIPAAKTPGLIP